MKLAKYSSFLSDKLLQLLLISITRVNTHNSIKENTSMAYKFLDQLGISPVLCLVQNFFIGGLGAYLHLTHC